MSSPSSRLLFLRSPAAAPPASAGPATSAPLPPSTDPASAGPATLAPPLPTVAPASAGPATPTAASTPARAGRSSGSAVRGRRAGLGAELLHLQLEPAGVALLAGDAVLGADGGEGTADGEARQQEGAMGIGGRMGKEEYYD